jgi:hypothetical protein
MIYDKAGSAKRAVVITPADTDLAAPVRGLYVGTAGVVRITTVGGDDVTIPSVPAGAILPLEIKRVWLSTTSASGFVGLFD